MPEQTSDGIQSASAEAQGRTEEAGDVLGVRAARREGREGDTRLKYTRREAKKFWKNVDKNGPLIDGMSSVCWEWSGCLRNGYGVFYSSRHGKNVLSHRFSWVLHSGEILSKKDFICHKCDNPACVNPEHLFRGDALANARDKVEKGRQSSALTSEQVIEIFKARGKVRMWDIEKRFPWVCRSTIRNIWAGKTWTWLTGESENSPAFHADMKKLDDELGYIKTTVELWTVARNKHEAMSRAMANQFSFKTPELAHEAYGHADLDSLGLRVYRVTLGVDVYLDSDIMPKVMP